MNNRNIAVYQQSKSIYNQCLEAMGLVKEYRFVTANAANMVISGGEYSTKVWRSKNNE
jgi:hypothetical protein